MNNIQKLTDKLHKIHEKFGVNARDLEVLGFICGWWDKDKTTRVMDIVKANTIASPSTVLHILKDLEFVGVISFNSNAEDAREKFIEKGKRFAALDKALDNL